MLRGKCSGGISALPAALAGKLKQSVASVRPFVSTHCFVLNWLTLTRVFVCMSHDPNSPWTESEGHGSRSRSVVKVLTDGHNRTFLLLRHQQYSSAARRAARRSRGKRMSPACVGVVTRSVWPRSSTVDSFPSYPSGRRRQGNQFRKSVTVCPRFKWKTTWAINNKVYSPWHTVGMHWYWGQQIKIKVLI